MYVKKTQTQFQAKTEPIPSGEDREEVKQSRVQIETQKWFLSCVKKRKFAFYCYIVLLFASQLSLETMDPVVEIEDEQEKVNAKMYGAFWLGFSFMESPLVFHMLNLSTVVTMILTQLYGAAVIYYLDKNDEYLL